ncbi:MAG: hypothetical protein KGL68_18275, partial [Burkholderiales bacterium]|nr:hypothetical protein [Burkholderiales bacterium]
MKFLFATLLIAGVAGTAAAQAPSAGGQPAAKKPTKPVSIKHVKAPTKRQAIEETTPTEDYDPADKLDDEQIAIAKRVYTGDLPCELGERVRVKAMKREGYFFVARGIYRYVMHPVESRTGAIRLEDPQRGAVWLQLGNKSMLLNQKEGKRIADDCQSPEQVAFAKTMKPVNLLEPAPAAKPAAAATPAAASTAGAGPAPASPPAA